MRQHGWRTTSASKVVLLEIPHTDCPPRTALASRRCSLHGINFPNIYSTFGNCPVCVAQGEAKPQTFADWNAAPDDDWEAVTKRLILDIKRGQEERALIPAVMAEVTIRDGQMWVSAWDVFPAVDRRLRETELFRIGQQVFEVLHYSHDRREYLVRSFSMTLSDEDLRKLADG